MVRSLAALLALVTLGTPAHREGFVTVSGGRLFYEEAGEGPAVVLIHGGFLDHRMWDGQMEVLSKHHRVVRYDLRFHGRSTGDAVSFSDVDDLAALMDSLGVDRADLVGLSLGGQVALDLALREPDRVSSLVLTSSSISGLPVSGPEIDEYMKHLYAAIDADDFQAMLEVFARTWCDGPARSPDQVDRRVREEVMEMLRGSLPRWQNYSLALPTEPPALSRLGSLAVPVLVVVGSLDVPAILQEADTLVAHVRDVRRVVVPNVAHGVPMEAPGRFNEILTRFLDGGEARRPPRPAPEVPTPDS